MEQKAIFITYDQAHHESILEILERHACRGFTSLSALQGRGSDKGEPHYGTHAWPSLPASIISIVPAHSVDGILIDLKCLDLESPKLGLRAFVWNIERSI